MARHPAVAAGTHVVRDIERAKLLTDVLEIHGVSGKCDHGHPARVLLTDQSNGVIHLCVGHSCIVLSPDEARFLAIWLNGAAERAEQRAADPVRKGHLADGIIAAQSRGSFG